MTSERPVTRAARRLSDDLRDENVDVSPREIERWQQEYGLIEGADRSTEYPPGALEQARQVRKLLDEGLDLSDVAVLQFMRNRYVEPERLGRLLMRRLQKTLGPRHAQTNWHKLKPVTDAMGSDIARRLARDPRARWIRAKLHSSGGAKGERINQTVARLASSLMLVFKSGEPFTRRDIVALLTAGGLTTKHLDIDTIVAMLRLLQQPNLETALQAASRSDLRQARDDYLSMRLLAERRGLDVVTQPRLHEISTATPVMLALRNRLGDDLDHAIETALERGVEIA